MARIAFSAQDAALVALLASMVVAGCSGDPAPEPGQPSAGSSTTSATGAGGGGSTGSSGGVGGDGGAPPALPWTAHFVSPEATDPAITYWLTDHVAGRDEAATAKGKLFVHMPDRASAPVDSLKILTLAAKGGYHVIGLSYPNNWDVAKLCADDTDVDCFENVRMEIIDGMDRSTQLELNAASSITGRLIRLLTYLHTQFPEEGWGAFLEGGEPAYPAITFSGHSQGGGYAALIAKYRNLDRVVMFSAVTDGKAGVAPKWVNANHETPIDRYYGLVNTKDPAFNQILANWTALNMGAFGPPVDVEQINEPYGNSHQLETAVLPQSGDVADAHNSTVVDADTPLTVADEPKLLEAWRYLLGLPPPKP